MELLHKIFIVLNVGSKKDCNQDNSCSLSKKQEGFGSSLQHQNNSYPAKSSKSKIDLKPSILLNYLYNKN